MGEYPDGLRNSLSIIWQESRDRKFLKKGGNIFTKKEILTHLKILLKETVKGLL